MLPVSYSLISATKFDGFLEGLKFNHERDGTPCAFFLLSYHLDRLVAAARIHGWNHGLTYDLVKSKCEQAVNQAGFSTPCKIRLILDSAGNLDACPFPGLPFPSDPTACSLFNPSTDDPSHLELITSVYLDTQPTPSSIFTFTKTTSRQHYDQARVRVDIPPLSSDTAPSFDVLLYNSENNITESSVCNVAFWRSSKWTTPPVSTGCLPGVMRRWLLEQGRIVEADEALLTTGSIQEGEWILLTNGVIGCKIGKIMARNKEH